MTFAILTLGSTTLLAISASKPSFGSSFDYCSNSDRCREFLPRTSVGLWEYCTYSDVEKRFLCYNWNKDTTKIIETWPLKMIVSFIFISLIFSFIACIIKFLRYHLRGLAIGLCCLALGSGSSALMLMTCFLSSFFANGDIFDFKYTTVYPGEGFFFTIGGILAIFSALILISVEPICTVGGERVSWKRDDFMINEFRRILVQDSLFMTFLMRFLWTSVSLALSVFWITRKVSLFFKQSSTLAQKVTNLLAKLCVKNNN